MPLTSEMLTVWELGYRMAGESPYRWRPFGVPAAVRDNYRLLMNEILGSHLDSTLLMDKWHPGLDSTPDMHVRHYIDEIYDCIGTGRCKTRLLKYVAVTRWEFHHWCQQSGYPLPDFWYGCEYRWPEDEDAPLLNAEDNEATNADTHNRLHSDYDDSSETPPGREAGRLVTEPRDPAKGGVTLDDSETANGAGATGKGAPETVDTDKLRPSSRIRVACQEIARVRWKTDPEMTIAAMLASDAIQSLAGHYAEKTLRKWLSRVAPPEVREKRGRP